MNLLSNTTENTGEHCKGVLYRGRREFFHMSDGSFCLRTTLRRLKGCPGCPSCAWLLDCLDMLDGEAPVGFDAVEHGKLYRLKGVFFEDGDLDQLEVVLVPEPQKEDKEEKTK